jgi:hypothetical protein
MTVSTDHGAAAAPTVKFPSNSARRGVLLGLSPAQLTLTVAVGAVLLLVLVTRGLAGAAALAPAWAAAAALVLIRWRGRALADWAPITVRYALRRGRGQLLWLARPSSRPRREGALHLPGTAASLRVFSAPHRPSLAGVHDPHRQTLTAVVQVSSRAYALKDPAAQSAHVHGWGRLLAALARTGHVAQVQVLERTVPDSGDALDRHWRQHGNPAATVAGPVYRELLGSAGPAAQPHEAYVAIALDLKAARRLINQAGGGLTGAFTVLTQVTAIFDQSAATAGLTPLGWLSAQEIAAVLRTAYDPQVLPALERWSPTGRAQAEPAAAGPVVVVEHPGRVTTDTAHHAVYWIEEWPRIETGAGFLHPILFSSGIRRTLSLHYSPKHLDAALRDVQRRKATVIADSRERVRKGRVDSEADTAEYADIKARERQLIAGHADVGLIGLLTVSADTPEELRAACAALEAAAHGAAMVDLRHLTLQQAEAFTAAALPLARP